MLCRVKTEAVYTAVDAFGEQTVKLALNKLICGVEVGTVGDVTACYRRGAAVGRAVLFAVEISVVVAVDLRLINGNFLAELVGVFASARLNIVSHVVSYDVNDDFNAVLFSLFAQRGKLVLGAEPRAFGN